MSPRRTLAIARAHVRELGRRKLAIALLLALPMAFYFAAWDDRIAISFATVGFGWSIAIIALFSTQSMRAMSPRLALIGFRPVEMVIGRILSIALFSLTLGALIFSYLRLDDVVQSPSYLLPSLGFAFLGSCTVGLAVGAVIDREMEAMLVLIGAVALTLVVDWTSVLAKSLPMYATDRYAWAAVSGSLSPDEAPWRSTVVVSLILAVVAVSATLVKSPRIRGRSSS